jgi:hypothetical protein
MMPIILAIGRRYLFKSGSRSYSEVKKSLLLLIGKTAPDYSQIRRKANLAHAGIGKAASRHG